MYLYVHKSQAPKTQMRQGACSSQNYRMLSSLYCSKYHIRRSVLEWQSVVRINITPKLTPSLKKCPFHSLFLLVTNSNNNNVAQFRASLTQLVSHHSPGLLVMHVWSCAYNYFHNYIIITNTKNNIRCSMCSVNYTVNMPYGQ